MNFISPSSLATLYASLVRVTSSALFDGAGANGGDERLDRIEARARESVWRLQDAFTAAGGLPFFESALLQIRALSPDPEQARRSFLLWVNLLEDLAQEAEREYGSAAGRGAFKASQIKAILIHVLLTNPKLDLPRIPRWVEPLVIEIAVDWVLDFVVVLLNRYDLWEPVPVKPPLGIAGRIEHFLVRFTEFLQSVLPLVAIGNWLRDRFTSMILARRPLSAAAKRIVAQMGRDLAQDFEQTIRRLADLARWAAAHRREIAAVVELIALAVQEAEAFVLFDGPEKKRYARTQILVFLEEMGLTPRSGLWNLLTGAFLDWMIDVLVDIFHKRGLFEHRRTAVA